MLKTIIRQHPHGLSDEKTEFEILDHTSFQSFLGIETEGSIPDRTTVWNLKEKLGEAGAERLFDDFHQRLDEQGIIGKKGRLVDASFTDAPRQRNSRSENLQMRENNGMPEEWPEVKKRQKDVDARWAKKNNEIHFGALP